MNYIYQGKRKTDLPIKLGLFLISPILSLLFSIRTIKTKSSQIVFLLFAAVYGFTLYVPAVKGLENLSVDSTYHRQFFEKVSISENFAEWKERLVRYITFDVDYERGEIIKDYYLETIAYVSSIFSHNHHLLFLIAAVVFVYFYIKSLKFFVNDEKYSYSFYCFCLLLLFSYNQIINIHWLRFPTAAWVAVYSLFQIFIKNDKRFWLLLPCTILIHGSYFAFVLIIAICFLTRKYDRLWVVFFFLSFFISSMPQDILSSISNILPDRISMYFNYSTIESIEERASLIEGRRTSSFITLFGTFQNIYMNILMLLIIRNYQPSQDKKISKLFPIVLSLFTIVNFFSFVKEFSDRYRLITYPLVAYLWLQLFYNNSKMRKYIYFAPLILLYQMAYYGYQYYMTSDFSLIISPVIVLFNYFTTGNFI